MIKIYKKVVVLMRKKVDAKKVGYKSTTGYVLPLIIKGGKNERFN